MTPEKDWYEEFKMILELSTLIEGLEIQRKYHLSWHNITFSQTPTFTAAKVVEFTMLVNQLISDKLIDRAQAHKYIHDLLDRIFSYQFDIFFILP